MENELISFLNNLIKDIENKKMSKDNLKKIGEFYMSYKFNPICEENNFSKEDLKFFTLGWYIYTYILSNNEGK